LLQITGNRPLPGVLFGITHTPEGAPIIRERRVLKVGIGLPKGRGLNVWLHNDKKWYFRMAVKRNGRTEFETCVNPYVPVPQGQQPQQSFTRKEAERFYRENIKKAEMVSYPRKLGYFTFTRPVLQDDGTEVFEPDFEAIEAHGPSPTEIDIVFLDDNPFDGAYQMWSTTELRCKGDGVIARRVLDMAANDQEIALAEAARKNNERYFPIINGCAMNQCSYREPVIKGNKEYPSPCKPGGDLKFQLASNIRVGGTAYFHTTGFRSISQIFSSIEQIKTLTGGRLAGIPLKMVLRAYRTRHNDQSAMQYGVGLEFRAEDLQALRKNLMEQAWRFREIPAQAALPARYIEAPTSEAVGIEEGEDDAPIPAQAMADEYYPGVPDDDGDGDDPAEAAPAPQGAAAATNAKTTALAEKLAKQQGKRPAEGPAPAPSPDPAAAQAAGPAVVADEDRTPEDPEDPRFQRKPGDMF
jgi:hypothetical protein